MFHDDATRRNEWLATAKQLVRDVLRELLAYYKAGAIGVGASRMPT